MLQTYSKSIASVLVIGVIATFLPACAERIYNSTGNIIYTNRNHQNLNTGRRDWVNTNVPSPTQSSQGFSTGAGTTPRSHNPPWGTPRPQNLPQHGSQNSGRRDYVNPMLTNQPNTTPWPALGQRRGSTTSNPAWVRPVAPQSGHQGGGGVSLADVLKYPSNNPTGHVAPTSTSQTSSVGLPQQSACPKMTSNIDDDLKLFSECLLQQDVNNPARHVAINFQGKTSSRSRDDKASKPLMAITPEAYNIPTVSKLIRLHDNYILETTKSEITNNQETDEENAFLDAVISTPVMQATKNFLMERGFITKNPSAFKDLLRRLWFNMYPRGTNKVSSSGFEHVFLAEIRNPEVSGLHNWLYFHDQESKNKANYLGYMKKIDLGGKGAIVKFHFVFSNIDKPVGSMFIGTSPELEMALYTICFMTKPSKPCPMQLNGNQFVIRTFPYTYRGQNMIGSAFPEI